MHYMKKQMQKKKKYEFCDINYQLWQAVNRIKFTQSPKKKKKRKMSINCGISNVMMTSNQVKI